MELYARGTAGGELIEIIGEEPDRKPVAWARRSFIIPAPRVNHFHLRYSLIRVNRRVRRGVDGLVVAMAHLWSKFTKCLRASEGGVLLFSFARTHPHPSPPSLFLVHPSGFRAEQNDASFGIITSSLSSSSSRIQLATILLT
ncbi:hypothetical protein KQX54_021381 [Cotesia glomerata]|uniref:Uncharacterized protein n=1 Tax=Cotesia glomerata TaxID=32391 RepID=A0AAV7J8N2_COTGL|nr:hypothetical protein KQX54_021381 [Cotesia glomerata]